MVVHSRNCHPEEACGLVAFDGDGNPRMVYSLTNAQRSATGYTVEPHEHFGALRHAEARGWEIAGVFHSHPGSPAYPSETDIALAVSDEWLYVVVGLQRSRPVVRAFSINGGKVSEVELHITPPARDVDLAVSLPSDHASP